MFILTGGAGFIGSTLLAELNRRGIEEILVVDNLANSEKWRNLQKHSFADYLHRDKFIRMLREESLPADIEGIVHLGACSSTTEKNADFLMENNFHYSRDLCHYAIRRGIRFIHASSASTYGSGDQGFDDSPEGLHTLRPLNMYGYSKHLFDMWLARRHFPQNCISLKFFNVYGPNEYHKGKMQSVVPKLYDEIGKTGRATLFASGRGDIQDGCQQRDFVYVKDCAKLLAVLLLERKDLSGIRNVGTGKARTFADLARAVFKAMGQPVQIDYKAMPPELSHSYQYYTCANMDWLARDRLAFTFTSLEDGVEDYVRDYLSQNDRYL